MYLIKEDSTGTVLEAIMCFERLVRDIQAVYPEWKPKSGQQDKDKVEFWCYWDKDIKYAEADGIPLFNGVAENLYGFVPLIHAYSGFGMSDESGDPEKLAMSYIRRLRGKTKEETTIHSDLSLDIHKFVHRYTLLINKSGAVIKPDAFQEFTTAPYHISQIDLPPGAELQHPAEAPLPDPQIFAYYQGIKNDLALEIPPALRGIPSGVGGRQEDILKTSGLQSYNCVIRNASHAFARAIGMGLRMISEDKVPNLLPPGLKQSDIGGDYTVKMDMKAVDQIERMRNSVEGRTKVSSGLMSRREYLISIGMTEEEADDELDMILAEQYMLQNPDIAGFMGWKVAKEAWMLEEFQAYQEQKQDAGKSGQFPVGRQIGSEGGQPREMNLQTEKGVEEADLVGTRPIRRSMTPQ